MLSFIIDSFGDIHPNISSFSGSALTNELKVMIRDPHHKGKGFKIRMYYNQCEKAEAVKNAGFVINGSCFEFIDWVYRNGASIPYGMTGYAGVQVFLLYNEKVLVVEETRKRGKVTFVAGQAEDGEFPCEAAIRETKEELSLDINSENLVLFGNRTRTEVNVYGAMNFDYFYVCEMPDDRLEQMALHQNEIMQAFWVPLIDLINRPVIVSPNGDQLKTSPMIPEIAQHLLSRHQPGPRKHIEMLDCRQWHKTCRLDIDESDIMFIDLF